MGLCTCDPDRETDVRSTLQNAASLIKKRELDQAINLLEDLREKRGPEPQVVLYLAEAYLARNDLSKAVARLKDGLERHPDAAELCVPLARIYQQLNQYTLAREAFEKARALGVLDQKLSLYFGTCLAQLGDMDAADREFARALAAGAEEKIVKYNQALILFQKKQVNEAKVIFEDILAKEPKWAAAKRELARTLIALHPDDPAVVNRAMNLIWDVKDELKDDWHLFEIMGDGWLLEGDFDASVNAYTEALRLGQNPKTVEQKYVIAKQKQNEIARKRRAEEEAASRSAVGPQK